MGQLSIHMFDVGGQRSERKKVGLQSRYFQTWSGRDSCRRTFSNTFRTVDTLL